jgi:hypothetical protein
LKYILPGLSISSTAARLIGVDSQARKVTEIERLGLSFNNDLPVLLISSQASEAHGHDVGVQVHIFWHLASARLV